MLTVSIEILCTATAWVPVNTCRSSLIISMERHYESPGSVGPIVHVWTLGVLPALDENLWHLSVCLLVRSVDDVYRSLGSLLGSQVCHVAPAEFSLKPLDTSKRG